MYKVHIPTMEYGFIEVSCETIEEALAEHDTIQNMVKEKDGLSASEWKKVRMTMLNTSECDPNIIEQMSKAQRYWINETKKTLRDIKNNNN